MRILLILIISLFPLLFPVVSQADFINLCIYRIGGNDLIAGDAADLAKFDRIIGKKTQWNDDIGAFTSTWDNIKDTNAAAEIYLYQTALGSYDNHDIGNSWEIDEIDSIDRYNNSRGHSLGDLNNDNAGLFLLSGAAARMNNEIVTWWWIDFGDTDAQDYAEEAILHDHTQTTNGSATTNPPNDSTGVLTDSGASYTIDEWKRAQIEFTSGTASGNKYRIDSNTATELIASGDNLFAAGVRSGDTYDIVMPWIADGHFSDHVWSSQINTFVATTPTAPADYGNDNLWNTGMEAFADSFSAAIQGAGLKSGLNRGWGAGDQVVGAASWATMDGAVNPPDLVMHETIYATHNGGGDVQFFTAAVWKVQIDAVDAVANSDVCTISSTDLDEEESGTDSDAQAVDFEDILWFAIGSHLLTKEDNVFMQFGSNGGSYNNIDENYYSEYDELDLGSPVGGYYTKVVDAKILYLRRFELGYVIVNPDTTDLTNVDFSADLDITATAREITNANMTTSPLTDIGVTTEFATFDAHRAKILYTGDICTISSCAAFTESTLVASGVTCVATLVDESFTTDVGTDHQDTEDFIDSWTSAQSEAAGWNVKVRDALADQADNGADEVTVSTVTTTRDTATMVVPATVDYVITVNETGTVTLSAGVLDGGVEIVCASPDPNFLISNSTPAVPTGGRVGTASATGHVGTASATGHND